MVTSTYLWGYMRYQWFSELFAEVFGSENGIGVRSAVGMNLPQNIAVEIEASFLLEN